MKYCTLFSIRFSPPAIGLASEIRLKVREGEFVLYDIDNEGLTGKVSITVPVAPEELSIRVGDTPIGGGEAQKGIYVPESNSVGGILRSIVRVLSFSLKASIDAASLLSGRTLIAESESDEIRLRELESLTVYMELQGRLRMQTRKRFQVLDTDTLDKLLSREVGIALYSDALRLSTPIGQFRELWRVLESAFGQKGNNLLKFLANYPPAQKLEFDYGELKELHTLRGRASHAESSAGLEEYLSVLQKVESLLPRLECLADETIVTKKTWGTKGLETERLSPLRDYVNKEGVPVIILDES